MAGMTGGGLEIRKILERCWYILLTTDDLTLQKLKSELNAAGRDTLGFVFFKKTSSCFLDNVIYRHGGDPVILSHGKQSIATPVICFKTTDKQRFGSEVFKLYCKAGLIESCSNINVYWKNPYLCHGFTVYLARIGADIADYAVVYADVLPWFAEEVTV